MLIFHYNMDLWKITYWILVFHKTKLNWSRRFIDKQWKQMTIPPVLMLSLSNFSQLAPNIAVSTAVKLLVVKRHRQCAAVTQKAIQTEPFHGGRRAINQYKTQSLVPNGWRISFKNISAWPPLRLHNYELFVGSAPADRAKPRARRRTTNIGGEN